MYSGVKGILENVQDLKWHLSLSFSPLAYGIGLLITFVALAMMQMGQPALLYLVPCTLLTSLTVALWRRELPQFWTGSGFVVNTSLIWLPTAEEQKDFKKKQNNLVLKYIQTKVEFQVE